MSGARPTSTSRCGRRSRRAGRSPTCRRWSTRGGRVQALDLRDPPAALPADPRRPAAGAFGAIAAAGGLAGVHAENDEIVRAGIAAEQAAGHGADPLAHARSRPPVAEHEAIARILELARATACACTSATSRRRAASNSWRGPARRRRRERQDLPHYMLLDESELLRQAARRRSTPRCARRVPSGGLDLISSDHVGWPPSATRPRHLRAGVRRPGVELIAPLVHDALGATELARLVSQGAGQALRPVAAQGQPAARSRCRRARARPRRGVGDRAGGARHPRRLEPVHRPSARGAGDRGVLPRGVQVLGRHRGGAAGRGRSSLRRAPRAGGARRPSRSRPADAGLRCRGWRQEAILRLLENNLAIAEDPENLVVYAAHAKAARDHAEPRRHRQGADRARDGQTLVVQSGKPIAVLPTGPRARRCCSPTATSSAAGRRPRSSTSSSAAA